MEKKKIRVFFTFQMILNNFQKNFENFLKFFSVKTEIFFFKIFNFLDVSGDSKTFLFFKKVHHFFDDFATKNENFGCS